MARPLLLSMALRSFFSLQVPHTVAHHFLVGAGREEEEEEEVHKVHSLRVNLWCPRLVSYEREQHADDQESELSIEHLVCKM